MAATKVQLLMFMIACFVSGGLAMALSVFYGSSFFVYSIPGLVVGAFFGVKYSMFDKNKARQEEHRRRRNKH
ncbi:MAG TPA: hypothetical protein VHA09_09640 [Nitrososphaera sp.]|nr:hypothetical protein [Nitrososphaera sp.]